MTVYPTKIYKLLLSQFGPQQWWPIDQSYHNINNSDPRFEIIIGTILTQNTAWSNVEKALKLVKNHKMLSIKAINDSPLDQLKHLIKPSGFFNQKAARLQTMSRFLLENYHGDLDQLFMQSTSRIRKTLLNLNGIGPETADSILLYAGEKPIFVVDAYTKRLCARLELPVDSESYESIQTFFQDDLKSHISSKKLIRTYKEFHAVIVEWAKQYCQKRKPHCSHCPLSSDCMFQQELQ